MSRRIAIVASGSMGDVRPYAVLAGGFARAGWEAGLVANDGYGPLAASLGLPWFAPALPPLERILAWQRRQNAQESGLFDATLWDDWFAAYPALLRALAGAAVVVSRIPWVGDAARLLGIPFVLAGNLPREGPRADLPHVRAGAPIGAMVRRRQAMAWLPGAVPALNLASHLGLVPERLGLLWQERRNLAALLGLQKRHRATLAALADAAGAARLARPARPLLELVGLSPLVLPPRPGERFTGSWRAPAPDYAPPPALARLLAEGEPPVFIGFGSVAGMPGGEDFAALSRQVAAAVRLAGVRAVIARGWGGLDWPEPLEPGGPAVVVLDSLPHEWLFPRLGAAVHHCGVGTTLTALAAGIPSIAVPFLQDEPFWAWRLHDLGVAPLPLDPQRLTATELAGAIRTALDDAPMRARAAALGQALRQEDGLGTTVRLVEAAMAGQAGMREAARHAA